MDGQDVTTSNTILSSPPPFDAELSAPLARPDDDFGMSLSAAGTPNTPADDVGGTGSTVSPVSPIHINRQKLQHDAAVLDDEPPLPPPHAMPPLQDHQQYVPLQDDGTAEAIGEKDTAKAEDDDQVPVLTLSGILPAKTTVGGGPVDSKKSNAGVGGDDNSTAAAGGNGDHNSKDK